LEVLKSPLEEWHLRRGARMTDFHGWQMPLHYAAKVSDEVLATRRHVGLFDLCHMGRLHVRGKQRVEFLDFVYTNNVEKMADGQVTYGFLCNDSGGVIDDVTVYRDNDHIMLVVNAANREEVLRWLHEKAGGHRGVQIEDRTFAMGMCAVQGPAAFEVMAQISSQRLESLRRYHFRVVRVLGRPVLVSRTGYTGEDGFELYFAKINAEEVWAALVDAAKAAEGVPVGLAARDILRLEAGLPLHGQELTPQITPIEAGFDRFVDFAKPKFIGRNPLMASTSSEVSTRLIGFEMSGQVIPRTGHPICQREADCGRVTSGCFSPTLEKPIGMGYVEQGLAQLGQTLMIRVRGQYHPALVVRRPFHRREKSPK
jgi:aminomethyltransferase